MENLEELSSSLRPKLLSLLPILLILFIVLGLAMFAASKVMPAWRIHEDLTAGLDAGQLALTQQASDRTAQEDSQVIQGQIDNAHTKLAKVANVFLTQAQVDNFLSRLYRYAKDSNVQITLLQAQATAGNAQQQPAVAAKTVTPTPVPPYDIRVFRLEVVGTVPQLMNFVVRIREASLPGVVIANLVIKKSDTGQDSLAVNLLLHTSPFSTGDALAALPTADTPTPIPPSSTPLPTATPTFTPSPTVPTSTPSPSPAPTMTPTGGSPAPSATPTGAGKCDAKSSGQPQAMQTLVFSKTISATGNCTAQTWDFQLDKSYTFVIDIQRRSGNGQYHLDLKDEKGASLSTTQSSVDGRGILTAKADTGHYSLSIKPDVASGDWNYGITLWKGMPSLLFTEVQSSYSSHGSGAQPNVTTWRYTMPGPDKYRVEITRTDGSLEYDVQVLDQSQAPVATAKSSGGNASIQLDTTGKVYYVVITAQNGTNGSYKIGLAR